MLLRPILIRLFFIGCGLISWNQARAGVETPWIPLFNGRDLTGWTVKTQPQDTDKAFWRVDAGSILCDSLGHTDHEPIWLMTDREFGDFELQLKFQAYRHSSGNSGVQFRCRYDENADGGGGLDGPQVDIHPHPPQTWRTGLIYDETRGERRWVSPSLPDAKIDESHQTPGHVFKFSDEGDGWNELTIICRGYRVSTILNGVAITDWDGTGVLDNASHIVRRVGRTGHIALQVHRRDQLFIRYKDIRIRELKEQNH